jgi:hypothetical protein
VSIAQALEAHIAEYCVDKVRRADDDLGHRHEVRKMAASLPKIWKRDVLRNHPMAYRCIDEWKQTHTQRNRITAFWRSGSRASHERGDKKILLL